MASESGEIARWTRRTTAGDGGRLSCNDGKSLPCFPYASQCRFLGNT